MLTKFKPKTQKIIAPPQNFIIMKPIELNYNKIKSFIESSGVTLKDFSLSIDRSENWFYSAEKNNSMKVSDLCLICAKLDVPVQSFFDNNIGSIDSEDLLTEKEILVRLYRVNKQILDAIQRLSKV